MEYKTFKKIVNVIPRGTNLNYRNFSPLVISNDTMILSDSIMMVKYESNDINAETKLGISIKDFREIQKTTSGNVEFKEALHIDDKVYENQNEFMIYTESDRLFKEARERNPYTLPRFELENIKCNTILFNLYGIHYLGEHDAVLASNPIKMPEGDSSIFSMVNYKYFKAIMNLFKYFRIAPTIKYGSNRNILFESRSLNVILMLIANWDKTHLRTVGCDIKMDW